ncbi:MAG: RNHCP domain-containing protein [Planctomycetota bacterium]
MCLHCGRDVAPLNNGSTRNHCPHCLWSRHLDVIPGDRAADCGELMRPIAVEADARRGWMLVHCCEKCGAVHRNRVSLDDDQPDDFDVLLRIANGE